MSLLPKKQESQTTLPMKQQIAAQQMEKRRTTDRSINKRERIDDKGHVVSDPITTVETDLEKNFKHREPETEEEKMQQLSKDAEQAELSVIQLPDIPWDFTGGRFDKEERQQPPKEGCKRKNEVDIAVPAPTEKIRVQPVIFDLYMVRTIIDSVQRHCSRHRHDKDQ